jgi:hypothetical protein
MKQAVTDFFFGPLFNFEDRANRFLQNTG